MSSEFFPEDILREPVYIPDRVCLQGMENPAGSIFLVQARRRIEAKETNILLSQPSKCPMNHFATFSEMFADFHFTKLRLFVLKM